MKNVRCRKRSRTSTGSLAKGHCALCGQPIIPRLSDVPHPRDRRVCLPWCTPFTTLQCSAHLSERCNYVGLPEVNQRFDRPPPLQPHAEVKHRRCGFQKLHVHYSLHFFLEESNKYVLLVIPSRFERETCCLEGSCSIQLSYETLKDSPSKGRF